MCPHVGAVMRGINGNVSYNADPTSFAFLLNRFPLAKKYKLPELVGIDFRREPFTPSRQSRVIARSQCRVPFRPYLSLMRILGRHEKRIVIQPCSVFLYEFFKIRSLF